MVHGTTDSSVILFIEYKTSLKSFSSEKTSPFSSPPCGFSLFVKGQADISTSVYGRLDQVVCCQGI